MSVFINSIIAFSLFATSILSVAINVVDANEQHSLGGDFVIELNEQAGYDSTIFTAEENEAGNDKSRIPQLSTLFDGDNRYATYQIVDNQFISYPTLILFESDNSPPVRG